MRTTRGVYALAGLVLAATGCTPSPDAPVADPAIQASYVGKGACASCHVDEVSRWEGSHHELAMLPANESTVLGDFDDSTFEHDGVTTTFFRRDGGFFVRTDGPSGELSEFEVVYTFGADPLQQYLVRLARGHVQALGVSWDTRPASEGGARWFHLYPDEELLAGDRLHWTSRYQNWNLMCAACHSTGLRKRYDAATDSYETSWSEVNVSCEACHGPGSRHVAWAESGATGDPRLEVTLATDEATWVMDTSSGLSERVPPRTERNEIQTCAPCHSRRSQLGESDPRGQPFLDDYRPALLTESLYYPDGQIEDEVYVYGSFLQSKMYAKGVTCQDCHDPHTLQVKGDANSVCLSCHLAERFEDPLHHFHEPGTAGSGCVDCHMPATTYIRIDPRRDHSFRVPRPDLTVSTGSPNACTGCHQDEPADWAMDTVEKWYGHRPSRHYGEAIYAAWTGAPGAANLLSAAANDPGVPDIVKATVASLVPMPTALSSPDPLIRLGGLLGIEAVDPTLRHQLVVPLLSDEVRAVRFEAARVLAGIPYERFTPEQSASLARVLGDYRDALALNADWPETHLGLALLESSLGNLDAAEAELETALELDPGFSEAQINLADLYRAQGEDERAEATLRKGLEQAHETADLHHALGLALVRLNRSDEARDELRQAFELRPDSARFAYVYGIALHGAGRVDEAVGVLSESAELHPNDRDLRVALLTVERDRGNLPAALAHARRLLELQPADRQLRELVGELEAAIRR